MENNLAVTAAVDQFLAALAHGDMDGIVRLMVCPACSAEYPDFHSPAGSMDTLCNHCGWSSEDEARRYPE